MNSLYSLLLLIICVSVQAKDNHIDHSKFVKSSECFQCHKKESRQWLSSHHKQAMEKASKDTVLGNFDNVTFNYHGEKTLFYKKNNKFFVNTIGDNGKAQDYEVKYTFGVTPLQQYLIALPGGRLQAFSIAWDTLKKKWFHLHPEKKIKVNDRLHWSKSFYNWNSNCAYCHSTNIEKNYDPKTKTYGTTWSEVNVGCQACHGPGSMHVNWAKSSEKHAANNKGLTKQDNNNIELCAGCHSRRHTVSAKDKHGDSFYDNFMPALLREDLYYPDGRIKDEVFVYGSFLQSKMYKAGVTCIDCHNPHTAKLKKQGNALCVQCHNESSTKQYIGLKDKNYNSFNHTHHKPGSKGSQCISCHMPGKLYMQVDYRRDHSFRIPRPDLTSKIGVPNACNQCHTDKSSQWAASIIEKWFGKKVYSEHFAEVFLKDKNGELDAEKKLIELSQSKHQANIVRATAIELLAKYNSNQSINARISALANENVLIREAAVRSLAGLPQKQLINILVPLLDDQYRAIRIEAASILAAIPAKDIPAKYRVAFKLAIYEYIALQNSNLDMPNSYFNLANLYQKQGDSTRAIEYYQQAIDLDKSFFPAQQNLATLLSMQGKKYEAKKVLSEAIKQNNEQGELHYSLGLLFAEQNNMRDALLSLARAAELLPLNVRVLYNYGLALQSQGKLNLAKQTLLQAYKINNNDPDILYALTILYVKQKYWSKALIFAEKLEKLFPESKRIKDLISLIKAQS